MVCVLYLSTLIVGIFSFCRANILNVTPRNSISQISSSSSSCSDPLQCYLENLQFNIPDISVDIEGTTFSITDTVCIGIDLQSIPSEYKPPTTLEVGINGLGTECVGNYAYGKLIKGQITIGIKRVNATLDIFVEKEDDFPVSTSLSFCDLTSIHVDIAFSKTGLEYLAPAIATAIEKAMKAFLCQGLDALLLKKLTPFLIDKLDPALAELISATPDPYPVYGNHYLNWNSTIVAKLHNIITDIRGLSNLPDFLRCMANLGQDSTSMLTNTAVAKFDYFLHSDFDLPDVASFFHSLMSPFRVDLSTWEANEIYKSPVASIKLQYIDVSGTDTLNNLEILEPLPESKVTLRTAASLGNLQLDISAQFTFNSTDENGSVMQYSERLSVKLSASNINFVLDLVAAVDEHLLNSYYMDQLGSLSCWLAPIAELSVPNLELDLSAASLAIIQVTGDAGLLESDIVQFIDNAILLVLSDTGFGKLTLESITGLLQGQVRQSLNKKLADSLTDAKSANPCLSHYPYDDEADYIQWAQSSTLSLINTIVDEKIGYSGLNKIFSCGTNGTGAFTINTKRLSISFSGLTGFYELQLLSPFTDSEKEYHLSTKLGAGYCPSPDICNPLKIEVTSQGKDLLSYVLGTESSLTNTIGSALHTVDLVMTFENFDLQFETLTMLDKNVLRDLQHYQLGTKGCYASTLDKLEFEKVHLNVSDATLIYKDGENQRVITSGVNNILAFLTRNDTIFAKNTEIAGELTNAPTVCAAGGISPDITDDVISNNDSSSSDDSWKWELFILIIGCFLSLAALLMAYQHWGRDSKINCLVDKLEEEVIHDDRTIWERWDFANSLMFTPEVPTWLRYSVPLVIVGNMALFLNSNLDPDAVQVMVKLHLGDKTIDVGSIFSFGLSGTVHDMWDAGVYPLSILIAFFSGAWPYIKLASMLVAWVAPLKFLTVGRRETVLIVLDALGKWSLIDFFVMVLMLCAFYIQLQVGQNLLVDVTVKPNWGFYGFLLATMMSLGLGHTILACHRLIVEPKVLPIPDQLDPRESLSSLVYEVKLPAEIDWSRDANSTLTENGNNAEKGTYLRTMCVKFTYFGKVLVGLVFVVTALFVVAGTFLLSMGFEFKGLVGLMLKDDAKVDYSYVSVGTSVPEHSGVPNDFAVRWLQASYFLFGLGMPLALMTTLMVLWTVPLTINRQRQLFVLSEIFNAWSTLDVFCVSIVAALLEIQQFAAFIVGDSCDQINEILAKYLDQKLEGDDKCFDVVAYVKDDSWALFIASGLMIIVGSVFLAIGHHAVQQRLENTKSEVLEHVRRQSRSLSAYTSDNKTEAEVVEDGAIDKTLVEPLVEASETHNLLNNQTSLNEANLQPFAAKTWNFVSIKNFSSNLIFAARKVGLIEVYPKEDHVANVSAGNEIGSTNALSSSSITTNVVTRH